MIELLAALVLGLVSSGHCVAMCGPLVVALHGPARRGSIGRLVCHHAGRLATYAALGALAGGLGWLAAMAGFGRVLAVGAGALLLISVLRQTPVLGGSRTLAGLSHLIARGVTAARARVDRHPIGGGLVLGGLNGLLPCTPVYAASTAAAALADPVHAATFMLLFGLGTIPSLALVSSLPAAVPAGVRQRAALLTPLAVALLGLLLIGRSLPVAEHVHAFFGGHSHH